MRRSMFRLFYGLNWDYAWKSPQSRQLTNCVSLTFMLISPRQNTALRASSELSSAVYFHTLDPDVADDH